MSRRIRIFAALLALVSLAFGQLAVSAYACPTTAMHQTAQAMPEGCDHAAADNANLCERHCSYGDASFDLSKRPAPPAVLAGPCLRVASMPVVEPPSDAANVHARAAGPEPPLTRFTVLRI